MVSRFGLCYYGGNTCNKGVPHKRVACPNPQQSSLPQSSTGVIPRNLIRRSEPFALSRYFRGLIERLALGTKILCKVYRICLSGVGMIVHKCPCCTGSKSPSSPVPDYRNRTSRTYSVLKKAEMSSPSLISIGMERRKVKDVEGRRV